MRKGFQLFLLVFAFLIVSYSRILAFPIEVQDDLKRKIKFSKAPSRIISLAPTYTELLLALGLKDKIIGVTNYCRFEELKDKERIGGFLNPNIEKIISLKPDLILALGDIQVKTVFELEKRKQRVFWVYPHNIQDILNYIEKIGKITGKLKEARKLKEKIERKINCIRKRLGNIPESERVRVFRVMGLDPPGTVGGLSFQSDVFYLAGGVNVFSDVKRDFFQITFDMLKRRNPDVIVICGNDEEEIIKKVRNHKEWKSLKAVKENKILVISCDLICRPGIHVAETIEKIAEFLYPEKF